ncbi:hypothetical protein ACFV1C_00220 [Streptomyces sp. NPDC059605]
MGLALELFLGVILWTCARDAFARAFGFLLMVGVGLVYVLKALGVQ